jgi:hypothetical protein
MAIEERMTRESLDRADNVAPGVDGETTGGTGKEQNIYVARVRAGRLRSRSMASACFCPPTTASTLRDFWRQM